MRQETEPGLNLRDVTVHTGRAPLGLFPTARIFLQVREEPAHHAMLSEGPQGYVPLPGAPQRVGRKGVGERAMVMVVVRVGGGLKRGEQLGEEFERDHYRPVWRGE